MKFAFLPNYFKKIGVICFCASFAVVIISTVVATCQAFNTISGDGDFVSSYQLGREVGQNFATANYWVIQIGSILLLLSMAFYMLAKEKVDDEYMDVMRWESLRLAVIVCIGVTMFFVIMAWTLSAKSILLILFITYLITFKVKKSKSIAPDDKF